MQSTLEGRLECVLSDEKIKGYIDFFNTIFGGMMEAVRYTSASLVITGTNYKYTFTGNGRQMSHEPETRIDSPQILLAINPMNLLSLIEHYEAKRERIRTNPKKVINEFEGELGKFTIVINTNISDDAVYKPKTIGERLLPKYCRPLWRLGWYAYKEYGVKRILEMVKEARPDIKFQKISDNYSFN